MLEALVAASVLLVAPACPGDEPPPPDPERVRAAVESVETALGRGEPAERVAAIQSAAQVVDAKVIEAIAKGLRDAETAVKAAALGALRFMDHPDALEVLTKTYKRDKDLRQVPELYEAMIKGIAQHGEAESVDLLTDFSTKDLTHKVLRARILGLGMIRARESVEGVFAMMAKIGRGKLQPYMGDFRTALIVLVGDDHGGESVDAWQRWWQDNKKTVAVSPQSPELPARLRKQWNQYWSLPDVEQRPEERRERGGGETPSERSGEGDA